ncbi:uncharacterized protein DS421_3g61620 [Arachis hypogaea]|nr:uncharacterized protein DS421_3g61620 [Arachis hypogaea]
MATFQSPRNVLPLLKKKAAMLQALCNDSASPEDKDEDEDARTKTKTTTLQAPRNDLVSKRWKQ